MRNKTSAFVVILIALLGVLLLLWRIEEAPPDFVARALPLNSTQRLFDIGVVDANGDDLLDIYTSNHHFRQVLWIADEKGGYRDVVSEWGLDQSKEFPLAELSFVAPVVDSPGLYIYWIGTQFVIRSHKILGPQNWHGTLRVNDPVDIIKNSGFTVEKRDQTSLASETIIKFTPASDGFLRMRPGGQGLPITLEFDGTVPLGQIYVGRGKVSPSLVSFVLAMKDRHAMAWADYNGDGVLDVFINRGALSGTLRAHTTEIKQQIKDELLVSRGEGEFVDVVSEVGIEKRGCSGRHARWLDFDSDGRIDLFVNCYDREHVAGSYPKQLYRQGARGKLHDVAQQVGLGVPDQQIGSFGWFDVDNDGDTDVLAFQDEGFFLYRNEEGHFVRELVLDFMTEGSQRIGQTTGAGWFYDGKLTIADYDTDGDLDAFSASKRGNTFLVNRGGKLFPVDPVSVGLPVKSVTANWVDYDNDGLPDLHLVPQGLVRQRKDHNFQRTTLLEFPSDQYDAAICNWFDLDNDGRLDVIMALHENADYKPWWQISKKEMRESDWELRAFRNIGRGNHWLQIKLIGSVGNRQGIGARVTVETPDRRQVQEVGNSEGSFFSQGHYRLYFGLGPHAHAQVVRIHWSDGLDQVLNDVAGDRLLVVRREGSD